MEPKNVPHFSLNHFLKTQKIKFLHGKIIFFDKFFSDKSTPQGYVVPKGEPVAPTELGYRLIFEWKRFICLSRYGLVLAFFWASAILDSQPDLDWVSKI